VFGTSGEQDVSRGGGGERCHPAEVSLQPGRPCHLVQQDARKEPGQSRQRSGGEDGGAVCGRPLIAAAALCAQPGMEGVVARRVHVVHAVAQRGPRHRVQHPVGRSRAVDDEPAAGEERVQ
jgi:hypothetical protein